MLEKLMKICHSPTGVQIATAISGFLKGAAPVAPSIQATPQPQPTPPVQQAEQQTDQHANVDEQQRALAERINKCLEAFKLVFPDDPLGAMEATANYAKNNPDIAKNLLSGRTRRTHE